MCVTPTPCQSLPALLLLRAVRLALYPPTRLGSQLGTGVLRCDRRAWRCRDGLVCVFLSADTQCSCIALGLLGHYGTSKSNNVLFFYFVLSIVTIWILCSVCPSPTSYYGFTSLGGRGGGRQGVNRRLDAGDKICRSRARASLGMADGKLVSSLRSLAAFSFCF